MQQGAPRTSIAPSLSPDSSLSSAFSFESAHGDYKVAAHPGNNKTPATADEDVKLEKTNSKTQRQKRGAAEPQAGGSATKKRKTVRTTAVGKPTLDEETATRVRRSRTTTQITTKVSTNRVGQASSKVKTEQEESLVAEQEDKPKRSKKTTKIKVKSAEDQEEEVATPKKSTKRTKKEVVEVKQEAEEAGEEGEDPPRKKRRRKTKEEKEAEAMPLAARTTGLRMFLGAHVSSAKGGLQSFSGPTRFDHVYSVRVGLNPNTRCTQLRHQLRAHRVKHLDSTARGRSY